MQRSWPRLIALILALQLVTVAISGDPPPAAPAPEDRGVSGLALVLRRLQTIGSVLHTGAHPDDESTELLAYLARGQGARVAYLSLNRGEGGQNGIGPELWEGLGVIRTEELLAARRLDGAEQYFTRAFDFGFTRSAEETLQKWKREEILSDMVRVIRLMRPLVVVNGFSGTPQDGHGQHQVAGMLTPEAIAAAADPARFPEQLSREGLQPWRVLKLYGRRFVASSAGPRAEFDVGMMDPVLGRSHAELAADGRSRHRSQDFGMIQARGSQPRTYPRLQSLVEVPEKESSLFTGLETNVTGIARFAGPDAERLLPGLNRIRESVAKAVAGFQPESPAAIAPWLASGLREVRALRASLGGLDPVAKATVDGLLARKEEEFTEALTKAHGVVVDALSEGTEIVTPGEAVEITVKVYLGSLAMSENGANSVAPKFNLLTPATGWQVESLDAEPAPSPAPQPPGRGRSEKADSVARFRARVPESEPPTQPYWLAQPRTRDQFDWNESMPRNLPFGPALARARVELTLSGERVVIEQPVEYRFADKTFGEIRRELKVAPALTLAIKPSLLVVSSEGEPTTRELSVDIRHNSRRPTQGTVRLQAPPGWKVEADPRPLNFTRQGERANRWFKVTLPQGTAGSFSLKAVAESGGREHANGYTVISYPHIENHFIYRPATSRVEVFDVRVARGLKVGYVIGSGDDGPEVLSQLGVDLKILGPAELSSGDLSVYDTIVLGIRVYEVNEDLIANNKRLLDYVAEGGTLIVQYNKDELARGNFTPYPVQMQGGLRVTNENAPITVLVPDHPLFNFPNRITEKDWSGWVQERGLYFLNDWDSRYTALLAAPDENGNLLQGGQLIASYGKGQYVFTAYAWFRQFPAGVPGAYRLFANMVSLPKRERPYQDKPKKEKP